MRVENTLSMKVEGLGSEDGGVSTRGPGDLERNEESGGDLGLSRGVRGTLLAARGLTPELLRAWGRAPLTSFRGRRP